MTIVWQKLSLMIEYFETVFRSERMYIYFVAHKNKWPSKQKYFPVAKSSIVIIILTELYIHLNFKLFLPPTIRRKSKKNSSLIYFVIWFIAYFHLYSIMITSKLLYIFKFHFSPLLHLDVRSHYGLVVQSNLYTN